MTGLDDVIILFVQGCDRTSGNRQLLWNATRSPLNVLPTNLKLIDDRSIVDRDISIATPPVKIASRSIASGLAAGKIAIADISEVILPTNNGFSQVPI